MADDQVTARKELGEWEILLDVDVSGLRSEVFGSTAERCRVQRPAR